MKNPILIIDTVDDRREIWHLLHRLPPADRVRFLQAVSALVKPNEVGHLPVPSIWQMQTRIQDAYRSDRDDEWLTNEVYCDTLQILNVWKVHPDQLTQLLTEWVRRPDVRRMSSRPRSSQATDQPSSSSLASCVLSSLPP